jgi:hypothetical protein
LAGGAKPHAHVKERREQCIILIKYPFDKVKPIRLPVAENGRAWFALKGWFAM